MAKYAFQNLYPPCRRQCSPPLATFHPCCTFAGSNLISTFAITNGWCSPALPANVYDRSNPFAPRTLISQLSFSRDPTIDTRQSPGLSLRACSISARTSGSIAASPVLCSSINKAISIHFTGSHEQFGDPSVSNSHAWLRFDHSRNVRHPSIRLQPILMLIGIGHDDDLVCVRFTDQFFQPCLHR